MGSCCSYLNEEEENRREAYQRQSRPTSSYYRPTVSVPSRTSDALFGEYRCSSCGRTWSSRLSWMNSYQICKRCRTHVFPYNQRELRPSDMSGDKENNQEHPKELCERCQTLGHYCGRNRRQNDNITVRNIVKTCAARRQKHI